MNTHAHLKFQNQIYIAFMLIISLHALAAYSVGPVPIQWIAESLIVALTGYVLCQDRLALPPGIGVLAVFIGYACLDTVAHTISTDYASYLPVKATTSYFTFLSLRFFGLLVFACALTLVYWALQRGFRQRLLRDLTNLGGVVAVISIYIYFAQLHGWWEPLRTRLGTSGGAQSVVFSYAFHRAMGTFREPSHLAEWLVLPLFCSFAIRARTAWISRSLMMISLLLTGSLTGMIAIVAGLGCAIFAAGGSFVNVRLRGVARFALPIVVAALAFSLIAASRSNHNFSLTETLWSRIEPLLNKGGVEASNRNYVYFYLQKQEISIFGDGLGNANLKFTHVMHLEATASFLNIFVNYILSLGLMGLLIFSFFILYPFQIRLFKNGTSESLETFYVIAAYIAWIFVYLMHAEELSLHFAIAYALLVHSPMPVAREVLV